MNKLLIVMAVMALTACGKHSSDTTAYASDPDDVIVVNACLQRELFNECMKALPAGPQATKYNDWDEVVSQCRQGARYMSKRARRFVPPECEGQ